jgi:SagB-type dehydrogenase family enzyme
VSATSPTAEFASLLYGPGGVRLDDPAETFHEASRVYPSIAPGRLSSVLALARSPELQQTVVRSARTHAHRPAVELPRTRPLRARLGTLLAARTSRLAVERRPLQLHDVAAVLASSYAARSRSLDGVRRPVPSAGALYPLELYVLALAVERIEPAVLHYDPFAHRLSMLMSLQPEEVAAALVDPQLVDRASALVVVTGMFWRSRFKYGSRGYRFVLLEAGHVVQNAILAATALKLPTLPVGGFFDRRLDALVGADGLDEASIYTLLLGGR